MNLNSLNSMQFSTNPADYLKRLQGESSSSGSNESPVQELLQMVGEMLNQLQEQGEQGGGGTGGGTTGGGTTGGGTGTMPGSTSAMPTTGATTGGATSGTGQMTAQNAAGVLAAYMGANGQSTTDPNAMYSLAENSNGNTPSTVQQAANFMLQNPSIYQQIETHDVAGSDGVSGVSNLQWAAQGGLGALGNTPAGTGGTVGLSGSTGALPSTTGGLPGTTSALPGNTGALPGMNTMPGVQPGTTGDLVNDGKPLQQADEGKALKDFNSQDGADFQSFENSLSHGDGNSATETLANAVKSGKLSQSDAAALGAQVQQTANAHGGGKINNGAKNDLSNALGGTNVLAPGKTRGEIAFDNLTGINTSQILGVSTK